MLLLKSRRVLLPRPLFLEEERESHSQVAELNSSGQRQPPVAANGDAGLPFPKKWKEISAAGKNDVGAGGVRGDRVIRRLVICRDNGHTPLPTSINVRDERADNPNLGDGNLADGGGY